MDNLLPRFALAASVFVSGCSSIALSSRPAPVSTVTPMPVITTPAPARRVVPMICEDRRGREIPCSPR